jgi:hypothetical protein
LHEIQVFLWVCEYWENIWVISSSSPALEYGYDDSTEITNQCIKSNWIHFRVDSKLVSSSQCCHRMRENSVSISVQVILNRISQCVNGNKMRSLDRRVGSPTVRDQFRWRSTENAWTRVRWREETHKTMLLIVIWTDEFGTATGIASMVSWRWSCNCRNVFDSKPTFETAMNQNLLPFTLKDKWFNSCWLRLLTESAILKSTEIKNVAMPFSEKNIQFQTQESLTFRWFAAYPSTTSFQIWFLCSKT